MQKLVYGLFSRTSRLLDNSNTEFHETPDKRLVPWYRIAGGQPDGYGVHRSFFFSSVNNVMVVVVIMVTDCVFNIINNDCELRPCVGYGLITYTRAQLMNHFCCCTCAKRQHTLQRPPTAAAVAIRTMTSVTGACCHRLVVTISNS